MTTIRLIPIFLLWIAALLTGLVGSPLPAQAAHAASQQSFPIQTGEEALVDATIQIRILPSDGGTDVQTGLGTLVTDGCHTYLFTHNHWPVTGRSDRVQILNAQGKLLRELGGKSFQSLVVCEDAGLLVLRSPLPGDPPAARLGAAGAFRDGDSLIVAYLKDGANSTIQLLTVQLEEVTRRKGSPVFRLNLAGEEMPGPDAVAGGIWLNGELVGQAYELEPDARWLVARLELPGPDRDQATPLTIELLRMQPVHLLPSRYQVG